MSNQCRIFLSFWIPTNSKIRLFSSCNHIPELIVKYINSKDKITPIKQEGEATYASKISKDEAKIDFRE